MLCCVAMELWTGKLIERMDGCPLPQYPMLTPLQIHRNSFIGMSNVSNVSNMLFCACFFVFCVCCRRGSGMVASQNVNCEICCCIVWFWFAMMFLLIFLFNFPFVTVAQCFAWIFTTNLWKRLSTLRRRVEEAASRTKMSRHQDKAIRL